MKPFPKASEVFEVNLLNLPNHCEALESSVLQQAPWTRGRRHANGWQGVAGDLAIQGIRPEPFSSKDVSKINLLIASAVVQWPSHKSLC
eukprot:scaffold65452_cov44-Tisochrysis_lutea.AAC.1